MFEEDEPPALGYDYSDSKSAGEFGGATDISAADATPNIACFKKDTPKVHEMPIRDPLAMNPETKLCQDLNLSKQKEDEATTDELADATEDIVEGQHEAAKLDADAA